ncbi:hypothetical protein E1264_30110 [Actinomadura sp. KC216]|uniref:hypothetical protein n=1 Tax=Actinomadura sp. KC216 TaxID=2530370 RepID=UPI001047CE57|nr:hypothetical protein [Actinomadura sp. KC216]TDB82999.1 hypothetical protein E1264_30110 [Actinomadura sp. KC216]
MSTSALDLAGTLAELRSKNPVRNALLEDLKEKGVTAEQLRRLAAIEYLCHQGELVAYGTLLARFPHAPAGGFLLEISRLVYDAHPKLRTAAHALGLSDQDLGHWPLGTDAVAFNGFISYLALHGTQADMALAMYTDMVVYFGACGELIQGLRAGAADVPDEFLTYYEGGASEELSQQALQTVQDGLDRGDDPYAAVRNARSLEEHIGLFWRAAADTSDSVTSQ